jgi:hypothetical protein
MRDFFFQPQFLFFQTGYSRIIGGWSLLFFVDFLIQSSMFLLKRLQMLNFHLGLLRLFFQGSTSKSQIMRHVCTFHLAQITRYRKLQWRFAVLRDMKHHG